jgi:hypothetical protein
MAVGNDDSPNQSQDRGSRFARLTAAAYTQRPPARRMPPFDLHATVELIRESPTLNSSQVLAAQDTRPSIGKIRQSGGFGVEPILEAGKSQTRMSIHEILIWTRLDGHMELRREIPRGMALDLVLKGRKSEWRLVRGSWPRDEVLRGV